MNACQRNDLLLRKMVANGDKLTWIGEAVGTTRHRVKEYILANNIPHQPFESRHPLEQNWKWKGGRIIDKDGYVLIMSPNHPNRDRHNYMREHRLVMEQHLGRYLTANEVVHHKDRDKLNNTFGNLELFAHNSEHLAKELAGKCPKWTPDGLRRIQEGVQKSANHRQIASQTA